jgi:hypothetical protein
MSNWILNNFYFYFFREDLLVFQIGRVEKSHHNLARNWAALKLGFSTYESWFSTMSDLFLFVGIHNSLWRILSESLGYLLRLLFFDILVHFVLLYQNTTDWAINRDYNFILSQFWMLQNPKSSTSRLSPCLSASKVTPGILFWGGVFEGWNSGLCSC